MAAKSNTLSFAQLVANSGGGNVSKSVTERGVSYIAKKSAFVSAAVAAGADNFDKFYDIKRAELRTLSDMEVQREAEASVARLNAAAAKNGLGTTFTL